MDISLALTASGWVAVAAVLTVALLVFSSAARQAARVIMRVLAHPLLLMAVLALVYDGTRMLAASSGLVVTSVIEHWQTLAPESLAASKAFVTSRLGPALWDPALMSILRLPAWLVLGGLGLAFAYVGRKRRPVNVFAN